jgi:flavin-binding protein dodecin
MSTGRVIEVTGESTESFDDAIQLAISRAAITIRQLQSAWVKEQRVSIVDGAIATYQVNLVVTFELEE